jgi:hypothetical protein
LRPSDSISTESPRAEDASAWAARPLTSSSRASSDSAIRAAARTIAVVCGTTISSPPVMSSTPRTLWSEGSWIVVAAQLQRCTDRRKCSAPTTLTDWSSRRAMPGAFVPANRSSQLLPSTKPMASARRSTLGVPHTHSSWPAASDTAITASQSRAA